MYEREAETVDKLARDMARVMTAAEQDKNEAYKILSNLTRQYGTDGIPLMLYKIADILRNVTW